MFTNFQDLVDALKELERIDVNVSACECCGTQILREQNVNGEFVYASQLDKIIDELEKEMV